MPFPRTPLWQSTLMAIALATIGNTLLLFAIRPLILKGATPIHALTLAPVASLTVAGVLAAAMVFSIMREYMRDPVPAFISISIVALLLSFIPDFQLAHMAHVTRPEVGLLMLMHTLAAILIVWTLITCTERKWRETAPLLLPR